MTRWRDAPSSLLALSLVLTLGTTGWAQKPQVPFEPEVGQAGKDVIWVPTPPALVEKMLDVARVTSDDYVIDLGSGDGRNVIAAARRGARALGVEYNPDMVKLSTHNAEAAGVADKATFVQGDMFQTDFSNATVLALFLLPSNLLQLRNKFLDLRPGTRIVANTLAIPDWQPDHTAQADGSCDTWCTALLWIVPAKVGGRWRLPEGELKLNQDFQIISGELVTATGVTPLVNASLRGDQITFAVGDALYTGAVRGDRIEGTITTGGASVPWAATRPGN